MFDVPILYIVYNRPLETSKSFDVLRDLKPTRLYISADGANSNKPSDAERTAKVRKLVMQVDWPCEVSTQFSEENLGCRKGVEKALHWFFQNESEGIILEDDIIPNAAFFEFCSAMLNRYRDDERIFSINGCSVGYQNKGEAHGLTRYFNMWGWATWRRSYELVAPTWAGYDATIQLSKDPVVKNALQLPVLANENATWLAHWEKQFRDTYSGLIDTWDFQWFYTSLKNNKYSIRPSDNYVMNIGFGETATHHKFTESPIRNLRYTSDTYRSNNSSPAKVNYNYEIFNVGNLIHSLHLKTWKDVLAGLVPVQLKNFLKSNSRVKQAWQAK